MIRANANSINTNARAWAYVEKEGRVQCLAKDRRELQLGDGPRLLGESLTAGSCK